MQHALDWTADQYAAALALTERRLTRSEKAREAAELLLEIRSRALAMANSELRLREADLVRKLEQEAQELLSAQDAADVATFHRQSDKRMTVSANWCGITGARTAAETLDAVLSTIHPLERREAREFLRDLGDGHVSKTRDIRHIDALGEQRWLRWTIRDNPRMPGSHHGAVRNITLERNTARREHALNSLRQRQLRKLERVSRQLEERVAELEGLSASLEDARNRAIQSDRTKSRFLAMMSHDIRTPMNAILAMMDLLALSALDGEQMQQLITARASAEQMLRLLSNILEMARNDGWTFELQEEPVAIREQLDLIVGSWRQFARNKGLEISLEPDPALPAWITLDAVRLRQLIDNLVSNAIKYSAAGKVGITAQCMNDQGRQAFRITVSDQGHGIAQDRLRTLFTDRRRLLNPADRHVEGTGLGLSICQRIVSAMGGEIGVESKVGQGSSFWFELPCKPCLPPLTNPGPASVEENSPLLFNGERLKLLVAEDVETNRLVLSALLDRLGCSYVMVEDGAEAVSALAENGNFDAVLMDVSMPRMDGIEATRLIRAMGGRMSSMPIIGVTAFAAAEEEVVLISAGMNAIVTKPVRLPDLRYRLSKLDDLWASPDAERALVPVPDFTAPPILDAVALSAQLDSVPITMRSKLAEAAVADLQQWTGTFINAFEAGDEAIVARAHHALKGVCAGFGATALAAHTDVARRANPASPLQMRSDLERILSETIKAIQSAAQ